MSDLEAVRAHFEAESESHDFRVREAGHSFRRQRAWVLRRLPSGDGPVLEIGCGAGPMLPHLLGTASTVVAIDLTAKVLRETAGRYPAARFAVADASALP